MSHRVSLAVAVADIVGSGRLEDDSRKYLFDALGELAVDFINIREIRSAKTTGDGIEIQGNTVRAVVDAAFEVQRLVRETDWLKQGFPDPLEVRIGIDFYEGLTDDPSNHKGEISGEPAVYAARIEPVVTPGQIWATEAVYYAIRRSGKVHGVYIGPVDLPKGYRPQILYALYRSGDPMPVVPQTDDSAARAAAPPRPAPAPPASALTVTAAPPGGAVEGLAEHVFNDMPMLRNDTLSLCLVTLPEPDATKIQNDESRPNSLEAARRVLAGGQQSALVELLEPTAVILFPEAAFGSPDWRPLDELIQAFPEDVVVIAPFAATAGKVLQEWQDGTSRILIDNPRLSLTYNGLWCWVKNGDDIKCFCALKTFREQRDEVTLVTGEGVNNLALQFQDIILLPAICAELLREAGPRTVDRYKQYLDGKSEPRRVLVTGSLYQKKKPWHEKWQNALHGLIGLAPERMMVALANAAIDVPAEGEDEDRWRGLSGVFVHDDSSTGDRIPVLRGAKQAHVRGIQQTGRGSIAARESLAGAVMRCPEPSVLFGKVQWPPYTSTNGRAVWEVHEAIALSGTTWPDPFTAIDYEVERLLRRYPLKKANPTGLGEVRMRLRAQSGRGKLLASSALYGVAPLALAPAIDPFDDAKNRLVEVGHGIAHLVGGGCLAWCDTPEHVGQLNHPAGANVLLWRHGSGYEQRRELRQWVDEGSPHPLLLVIGDCDTSAVLSTDSSVLVENRDSTVPQEADGRSITAPRGRRYASIVPYGLLSDACGTPCDDTEYELHTALQQRIKEMKA